MGIIFVILPLALIFAGLGLAAYFWGVKSGQFDDLETPAIRMLFDEEQAQKKEEQK